MRPVPARELGTYALRAKERFNVRSYARGRMKRRSKVEKRLLTTEELSQYIGSPRTTIWTWVCLGKIPGVRRLGRSLRFEKLEIDAWISAQGGASASLPK